MAAVSRAPKVSERSSNTAATRAIAREVIKLNFGFALRAKTRSKRRWRKHNLVCHIADRGT